MLWILHTCHFHIHILPGTFFNLFTSSMKFLGLEKVIIFS